MVVVDVVDEEDVVVSKIKVEVKIQQLQQQIQFQFRNRQPDNKYSRLRRLHQHQPKSPREMAELFNCKHLLHQSSKRGPQPTQSAPLSVIVLRPLDKNTWSIACFLGLC